MKLTVSRHTGNGWGKAVGTPVLDWSITDSYFLVNTSIKNVGRGTDIFDTRISGISC